MAARRILPRVVAALFVLLVAFFALAPIGRYLVWAAWEEGRILARRRSIASLLDAPGVDPATRGKLALVTAARTFAVDSLGLAARQSFTSYTALHRDTLVLVLSAAARDALKLHTWWFPIVGRVPYKGYFDFKTAAHDAADMRHDGYDTELRPASAFSTLGWFNDPVLSSTLAEDSTTLANTVVHELTHNTFFAPGQVVFNESFANFVGSHGAERFFAARGDTAHVQVAQRDWAREKVLGRFWASVYASLDSAFKAHADDRSARLAARDTVFAAARQRFERDVVPQIPGLSPGASARLRLDNVTVMARRVYRTGLDDFDHVLEREGGNLRSAIGRVITLAKARPEDPMGAVREWLNGSE